MTINEALALVDEIRPNQYDDNVKIQWLSKLDAKIFKEVVSTHEDAAIDEFNGYTVNDMDAQLLVDDAYADLYNDYLFAMIDYSNQELDSYNNAMLMFEAKYNDFRCFYNQNHMPKPQKWKFF